MSIKILDDLSRFADKAYQNNWMYYLVGIIAIIFILFLWSLLR